MARLAQGPASASEALKETTEAAQNIAKLLAATNDEAKAEAQAIINPTSAAAPPATPDKEAQARFDRRKEELVRALDAIIARPAADTTQRDFKQRAEALKASVQKLTAPAATNDADAMALINRLNSLDDVLSTVQAIPDSGVQSEVAQIDLLRSYAQQGVGLGLSTSDFEVRRAELLNLLDLHRAPRRAERAPAHRSAPPAGAARCVPDRPAIASCGGIARPRRSNWIACASNSSSCRRPTRSPRPRRTTTSIRRRSRTRSRR